MDLTTDRSDLTINVKPVVDGRGKVPVPPEDLLSLSGVQTYIGSYHILHGVNLAIPKGQLTVLLGRNGAGKTTTLRTIMGLWRAAKGEIRFEGKPIHTLCTPEIVRVGIAYVPEEMGIFGGLTVRENLLLAALSGTMDEKRVKWIYELFPALEKFKNLPASALSGGQKQMLAIARAVIEPRKLILIDEPSKGLAPAVVRQLIVALKELKSTQATVLMVEQNFHMARSVADQVAVMDNGRIVYTGDMEELAENVNLQQQLLGLSLSEHQ
jgi:branched-chain amino acid transport system ATP-binding protein